MAVAVPAGQDRLAIAPSRDVSDAYKHFPQQQST